MQTSIKPTFHDVREQMDADQIILREGEHNPKIQEAQKRTLLGAGVWSDVRVVEELDITAGEPTGSYGFKVTRKEETPKV